MATNPSTSENSVTFSLAELAKLEEERVRDEERRRARARESEARERREAEARRRAAEAAEVAAAEEARAGRAREEAALKARLEARERVAADVARIEVEAKARLDADNAVRAHELATLRARAEGGHGRLTYVLAAALGLALCGGGAAAYGVSGHVAGLEQEAERLRGEHQALARDLEQAKAMGLAALDRRYGALRARPLAGGAEEARATAEAARNAIDAKALDHDRVRLFADALDALEARLDSLEKLAELDRRQLDLFAWASKGRRSEVTSVARSAGAVAKAKGTGEALRAYERALDQLRDVLAEGAVAKGSTSTTKPGGPTCDDPHDPMCGLGGKAL